MKVLLLGPFHSPLIPVLRDCGCDVREWFEPLDVEFLGNKEIDFAISYRYRHILKKEVIEHLQGKIINLHISFLPWNRGADPNLWSFLEDTPKGISIHYIDEGLDTGDIIAQNAVYFDTCGETLATTYKKLNTEILRLFAEQWPLIMSGKSQRQAQPSGGSYHRLRDKDRYLYLLADKGWDTPVEKLVGIALKEAEKGR